MENQLLDNWKQEVETPRDTCPSCGNVIEMVDARGLETYTVSAVASPTDDRRFIRLDNYETIDCIETQFDEYKCMFCGKGFTRSELEEIWGIE